MFTQEGFQGSSKHNLLFVYSFLPVQDENKATLSVVGTWLSWVDTGEMSFQGPPIEQGWSSSGRPVESSCQHSLCLWFCTRLGSTETWFLGLPVWSSSAPLHGWGTRGPLVFLPWVSVPLPSLIPKAHPCTMACCSQGWQICCWSYPSVCSQRFQSGIESRCLFYIWDKKRAFFLSHFC